MRTIESSPQLYARIGGLFYLLNIGLGFFSVAVRNKVIGTGDAAVTVATLRAMESLWRLGIVAEFVALICVLGLGTIYYLLFRPVSRELNLLVTFIRLVAVAVQAVVVLNLVAALFPLGNAAYLSAFSQEQLAALVRLAIKSHSYGFGLALLLFGCCFLVHGRLIFCSTFLPKVLGVLIQIAGLCYMTHSFALFLAPTLADRLFPAILLPAFVAEMSLCLGLIVKGVSVPRWNDINERS